MDACWCGAKWGYPTRLPPDSRPAPPREGLIPQGRPRDFPLRGGLETTLQPSLNVALCSPKHEQAAQHAPYF